MTPMEEAIRAKATQTFGEHLDDWMTTPLDVLDGQTPIEAIENGQHEQVISIVNMVENGVAL